MAMAARIWPPLMRADTVSIRLGQGDGTFEAAPDVGVGAFPVSITVGDFNGDGRPDLATANFDANTVSILINNTCCRD